MQEDDKTILLIDPLAEDKGHLLDDDLFWAEQLSMRFKRTRIISSRASISRIKKIVSSVETKCFHMWPSIFDKFRMLLHAKYILRMLINTSGFKTIIIQSFHELSALIFTYLGSDKNIYLVVTNNLTGEWALTKRKIFLQNKLFQRVSGIMVGSKFEKNLIYEIHPDVSRSKVHIIPYYKISKHHPIISLIHRKHRIAFLGFARKDRGLDNFLRWACNDKTGKYSYGIYGNIDLSQEHKTIIENIAAPFEVINGYLADDEYFKIIGESLFIALPFKRTLEGRLSGILCDAIACGTPVIAAKIEPHIDLFKIYGAFGYLLNIDDNEAWNNFLKSDAISQWYSFQKSLANAREANSPDNVMSVVMAAIQKKRC